MSSNEFDSSIDVIQGVTRNLGYTIDVTDVLPDTLSKAWFTVKRARTDSDNDAVIQKTIIPSLTIEGQIDSVGSVSEDGHLAFLLTADDTRAIGVGTRYYYDVKVRSSSGRIDVVDNGRIFSRPGITLTES